jgi:stringent starvation protein B
MFVHLDPRRSGVIVPNGLGNQPQLVLQIGLNMAIPIPDLKVEDDGLSCTLSFNRAPFWCRLPWNAVYALVGEDGRGMVWPDDVPPEVALQAQNPKAGSAAKPAKKGRKLSAVDASDGARRPRSEGARATEAIGLPGESDGAEARAGSLDDGDRIGPAAADGSVSPAGPGRKRRRELPPYLRVIK